MSEPYNGWSVLELLGHRRLHGLVQETTLAGAGMLRIDVYEGPAETPALTQYYPPSSVYCLTPATEEACRKAAMPWAPPALIQPREDECGPRCIGCSVCGKRCPDCQEWGEECTCVDDDYDTDDCDCGADLCAVCGCCVICYPESGCHKCRRCRR